MTTETTKYAALENLISNRTDTMFVVRATDHPAEDLERGWSAPVGGWDNEVIDHPGTNVYGGFETYEEAEAADTEAWGSAREYGYHGAYEGYVLVHYQGLGAWQLEAEDLADAIVEAAPSDVCGLRSTDGSGNGCFYTYQCVSYHKAAEDIYVFEITAY